MSEAPCAANRSSRPTCRIAAVAAFLQRFRRLPITEETAPRADWRAQWEARQKLAAALRAANKAALFDALAQAGIASVQASFDGFGDSGQIEKIEGEADGRAVALPAVEVEIASPHWDGSGADRRALPLREAIETLAFDLLAETHEGWELNDGAYGEFHFDASARSRSNTTSGSWRPTITNTNFERERHGTLLSSRALLSEEMGRRGGRISAAASNGSMNRK